MKSAKYVIIGTETVEVPIVFPEFASHADVARAMCGDCWQEKVLSAGFVDFRVERYKDSIVVECYGKSITLDKAARKEDARMIARALGMVVE